jgi:hypothetical protein
MDASLTAGGTGTVLHRNRLVNLRIFYCVSLPDKTASEDSIVHTIIHRNF